MQVDSSTPELKVTEKEAPAASAAEADKAKEKTPEEDAKDGA